MFPILGAWLIDWRWGWGWSGNTWTGFWLGSCLKDYPLEMFWKLCVLLFCVFCIFCKFCWLLINISCYESKWNGILFCPEFICWFYDLTPKFGSAYQCICCLGFKLKLFYIGACGILPLLEAWLIYLICGCDGIWGILGWSGNTWAGIFWFENCLKL